MRGRPKRVTAEQAIRRGNPGHRQRKALELAAEMEGPGDAAVIEPPAHLAPEVREIWKDYASSRVGAATIRQSDAFALERLCTYVHEWIDATLQLRDAHGRLRLVERQQRKGYGTVSKVKAEVRVRAQLEAAIRSLETQFGFTPASRSAVLERIARIRDPERHPSATDPRPPANGSPAMPASPIGSLGGGKPH